MCLGPDSAPSAAIFFRGHNLSENDEVEVKQKKKPGPPKMSEEERLRNAALRMSHHALEVMYGIMMDTKAKPNNRILAGREILDRGLGKAAQQIAVQHGVEAGYLESLQFIANFWGTGNQPPVIEGEALEDDPDDTEEPEALPPPEPEPIKTGVLGRPNRRKANAIKRAQKANADQ